MKQLIEEVGKAMEQNLDLEMAEHEWVQKSKSIKSIFRIPGDASLRKYFRIQAQDGKSYILMKTAPFVQEKSSIFFLEVQSLLSEKNISVPQVFDSNAELGTILLEDLGDETLLHALTKCKSPQEEIIVYKKVLEQLIQMQNNVSGSEGLGKINASKVFFDFEKLMWEVNYTVENFFIHYLKRPLQQKDLKAVLDFFGEICVKMAALEKVFVHRDFHSRNIMVQNGTHYFIDFQDARMGSIYYDLSSLLKDSYYQLSSESLHELLRYYHEKYFCDKSKKTSWDEFVELFDLMSMQRNFKAIGSFSSFAHNRGDYRYVKYIGNTFENIRRTLIKYPRYHHIKEVLSYNYYF